MLKIIFTLALLLPASELLACSMTPIGASALQLTAVVSHALDQYSAKFQSTIQNIRAVAFNRFVVTVADSKNGEVIGEHKYAVSIGADCSTKVTETGP